MIRRLCRIVALWWRSRRWVACSECRVTLTADEMARWKKRNGAARCAECQERAPIRTWDDDLADLRNWRPGMAMPLSRRRTLVYSTHDYRTTFVLR